MICKGRNDNKRMYLLAIICDLGAKSCVGSVGLSPCPCVVTPGASPCPCEFSPGASPCPCGNKVKPYFDIAVVSPVKKATIISANSTWVFLSGWLQVRLEHVHI